MIERENLEGVDDHEKKEIPFDELAPLSEKYVADLRKALDKNADFNRVLRNIFLAPEKYVGGNHSLEEGKRGESVVFHRSGFVYRIANEGGNDVAEKVMIDRFFLKLGVPDWETQDHIEVSYKKKGFNMVNGTIMSVILKKQLLFTSSTIKIIQKDIRIIKRH